MNASATARFDEGPEMELLIHARNMIIAVLACAIKNLDNIFSQGVKLKMRPSYMERYLTAVLMVAMAIRNPKIPTSKDIVIWPKRSPARSECLSSHVSKYHTRKAANSLP